MRQKVGFILVCYYTPLYRFKRLINAFGKRQVIVVDNTENESYRLLNLYRKRSQKPPKNVMFLTGTENLGYAISVNIGLKKLISEGADWSVMVNDDVICAKEDIDRFIADLVRKPPGVVGIYPGFLDQKRYTTILNADKSQSTDRRTPDYLSGSFWAIHKNVVYVTGYLHEPYFMYYEEVDYCLQAKQYGFPLQLIDARGITHQDAVSPDRSTYFHSYYLARNHLLFVERHAPMEVKLHELLRLPKTYSEHYAREEEGALVGIRDYIMRRFGNAKKHL